MDGFDHSDPAAVGCGDGVAACEGAAYPDLGASCAELSGRAFIFDLNFFHACSDTKG